MAVVRIACLNYEDGGLRNGAYDFAPLAAAFATLAPNPPDVIAICEGKEWGHNGGEGMHEACAALDRVFAVPYVGEPSWHRRGTYGPAIIWNPTTMAMDRWTGADHESNPVHDRNIARMRLRHEPDKRLNVLLRHYSFDSATERIMEAERDTGYARDDIPTLLAGDLNGTASSPLVPQRDWTRVPPWKLPHKSHRDAHGRPVSDTRALDMLIWPLRGADRRGRPDHSACARRRVRRGARAGVRGRHPRRRGVPGHGQSPRRSDRVHAHRLDAGEPAAGRSIRPR
jgi:endonuclease/exonuclease/phosphatase family metal-dependent hydrolase